MSLLPLSSAAILKLSRSSASTSAPAGLFAKQSHGLLKGYIIAVIARGAFHSLGGYLYWMSYMPDNFPKSLTAVYPILYNYSYLLAEGIITVIIISVPAVSKALTQVKRAALQ